MSKNPKRVTTFEGYAYTGGGRPVTRVELSVDGGHTWREAQIQRHEQPTPYGMYWCWIWWKLSVPIVDLMACRDVLCRAWDSSQNTQPMNATWNLLGHGTNHCFRLKLHRAKTRRTGKYVLRFEHPTQPGQQTGGWMERKAEHPESIGFGKLQAKSARRDDHGDIKAGLKDLTATSTVATSLRAVNDMTGKRSRAPSPPSLLLQEQAKRMAVGRPSPSPPPPPTTNTTSDMEYAGTKVPEDDLPPLITMAEVRKHKQPDDVWIVISGKVYDVTKYLSLHPGGVEAIMINAGSDCSDEFHSFHSTWAARMLEKHYIGDLDIESVEPETVEEVTDEQGRKLALHPRRRTTIRLEKKTVISRDSFVLDFALPTKDHVLGLPTGKHVFISAEIDGEVVVRRYTPISANEDIGKVQFVIKAYRPCVKFPKGGKMSQYLDSMKEGDCIDTRGPIGELEYLQNGQFSVSGKVHKVTHFNMIAGGTGIAPMMQVIAEILRNPSDETKLSLIYSCRQEGDLLMRRTLDEWARTFPDRFKVRYVLTAKWPLFWTHCKGRMDANILKSNCFPPGETVYNLLCGPPNMLQSCCRPHLEELGHDNERLVAF